MINKNKRLAFYKKMLWDYKISKVFPFLSPNLSTDLGFCAYVCSNHVKLEDLPELMQQAPFVPTAFKSIDGKLIGYWNMYWFKKNLKSPRIKCIKAAIKLCKQ